MTKGTEKPGGMHMGARVLCVLVSCLISHSAQALQWNWSYGGSEAGTFTTDGTYADAINATPGAPFTFNFADTLMRITASNEASLIGLEFGDLMSGSLSFTDQGFVWDGSAIVRSFSSTTPNLAFFQANGPSTVTVTYEAPNAPFFFTDPDLTIPAVTPADSTPFVAAPVSLPAALPLLASAIAAFAFITQRRRKTWQLS